MKRVVVACISLLLIAGCSSAPEQTVGTEAQFLTLMHSMRSTDMTQDRPTDASLITEAHSICGALDRGVTPATLKALMISDAAFNDAGSRVMLRASVVTYCPTHEDVVPARQ